MKIRNLAILLPALLLVFLIKPAFSYNDSRYVRLRYVEGNVTIHPSDNQRPTEATVNTPILDGDGIETADGRAELSFRNGILLRIGDDSSVRIDSAYSPMKIELQEGTVFVDSHMVDSFHDELEIMAADTQVYLIDEGNLRIDLGTEGAVRVTSIQGEAEVRANGRRVLLENGERTYIDPGQDPERPATVQGETDELDDWNQSRVDQYAQGDYGDSDNDRYLDDDIYYDGNDLDQYGDWRAYGSYGHVWVPREDYGWRPYYDGRWIYCNSGWFWVSYEPWGWAPYHYGRWGYGLDIGWYWIPGDVFAPAWVSWYDYGDYLGWCPLNFYNRPIFGFGFNNFNYYNRLPRIQKPRTLDITNSWTFVKKKEIGSPNLKRIAVPDTEVRKIKLDEKRIAASPEKRLVSYVIPNTIKREGYVNDKRMVKRQEDIRNPIGVDHRDETFRRGHVDVPKDGNRGGKKPIPISRDDRGANTGNRDRQFDNPRRIELDRNNGKDNKDKAPYGNRDNQFLRQNSDDRTRHSRSYISPYYRERDNGNNRDQSDDPQFYRGRSYGSRNNDKPDDRDLSPRYGDEARKIFERFDRDQRRNESKPDTREPDRYERPQPPPPQEYRQAPPPERHDNGNRGQSHGASHGGSGGQKPKDHH